MSDNLLKDLIGDQIELDSLFTEEQLDHPSVYRARLKEIFKLMMKQQDRDTRHACSEAILNCDDGISGDRIWKSAAHSAVMNCWNGLIIDDNKD